MAELDPRVPEGTESWGLVPARPATERRPYLLVLSGPQLGESFALDPTREIVLGRDPSCDIRLRDTGVSRRHASVQPTAAGVHLRDLGSTNGVFVEGARVADCVVHDGERLQMGMHTTLKYCLCDELEIGSQRRLAEGVLLDAETGLFNRRYFDDRLAAELSTSQRAIRPVALLLVGLEGLTAVAESRGRPAAEEALGVAAGLVRGAVRREDVVSRIAPEEFGVVARETPLSSGRALAERIRSAVERGPVVVQGASMSLSVSVGVVGVDSIGTFAIGRTDVEVLALAERALRRARLGGGNRVETEGPVVLP